MVSESIFKSIPLQFKNQILYVENKPNPASYKFRDMSQLLKNQIPPNVTITTKIIPLRRAKRNLPKDFLEIHQICCKEPKVCENVRCPPL